MRRSSSASLVSYKMSLREKRKGGASWGLIISMHGGEKLNLEQIRALLQASQEVRFAGHRRVEGYAWVGKTLRQQGYAKQPREAKGLLRTYLLKSTPFPSYSKSGHSPKRPGSP